MNLNRVKKIIIERLTIFWGKYWILEREKSHSECFSFFTSSFISLPLELLRVCFLYSFEFLLEGYRKRMRSFVSRFSIISCCTCWFVLDIWSRVACLFEFDGEKVLLIKQIWKYLIFLSTYEISSTLLLKICLKTWLKLYFFKFKKYFIKIFFYIYKYQK